MKSIKNSNNETLERGRRHKQGLISLRMIATRIGEFLIRSLDAWKNPSRDMFSLLNCQNIHPHYEFQKCINTNLVIGLVSFVCK